MAVRLVKSTAWAAWAEARVRKPYGQNESPAQPHESGLGLLGGWGHLIGDIARHCPHISAHCSITPTIGKCPGTLILLWSAVCTSRFSLRTRGPCMELPHGVKRAGLGEPLGDGRAIEMAPLVRWLGIVQELNLESVDYSITRERLRLWLHSVLCACFVAPLRLRLSVPQRSRCLQLSRCLTRMMKSPTIVSAMSWYG